MKKLLYLLITFVMILSTVTACGPQSTAAPVEQPKEEAPAEQPAKTEPTKAPEPTKEPEKPAEPTATAESAPAETTSKVAPGSIWNKDEFETRSGTAIAKYNEAPMLAEQVAAGKLPPVEERLPKNPLVAVPWNEVGEYGGVIRHDEYSVGYDHYSRHFNNVYGFYFDASETKFYNAGLAGELKPHVFESVQKFADGKEYVFKIREGLRWSDGVEVTTEDVKFRVEDELLNTDLSPLAPTWMRWNKDKKDVTTKVEVLDPYRFKVTFSEPYGAFVEQVGINSWVSYGQFMTPSHFYKKYHIKYADKTELLKVMNEKGFKEEKDWANFYNSFKVDQLGDTGGYLANPFYKELPVLYPWVVKEVKEDGSAIYERNPYFWIVDSAGNQLPYADYHKRQFINSKETMNLDILAGKVDMQGMFTKIDDYTLYKENEDKGNYNVIPAKAWQHHVLIYWWNPLVTDEKVSKALSNLEFRKALSMALDRDQINEAVFKGLGTPAQFAPPSGTTIADPALTGFAAQYDPDAAMAILDELGYKDTDGDTFRETPEGEALILPITYYQVTPAADAGVQMAETYWEAIGLNVESKQVEGQLFWKIQGANEAAISVWWANGPDFGDGAFISMGVSAPLWTQWWNSNGEKGAQPPDWFVRIRQIQDERLMVSSEEERNKLDAEGWKLLVDNLVVIGTVENVKVPIILSKDLGNVEYGFDKSFVVPTYLEWSFQWYFKNPARRTEQP